MYTLSEQHIYVTRFIWINLKILMSVKWLPIETSISSWFNCFSSKNIHDILESIQSSQYTYGLFFNTITYDLYKLLFIHSQWVAVGICCPVSGHQPVAPQYLSTAQSLGSQSSLQRGRRQSHCTPLYTAHWYKHRHHTGSQLKQQTPRF